MAEASVRLIDLIEPGGPGWEGFVRLYEHTFPAWEREPTGRVGERLAAGRYRLVVLKAGDEAVIGFHLVDVVPALDYAVLTFVAVSEEHRGRGLGRRLTEDAVERFRRARATAWLFVEAEDRATPLYRRCGFHPLALDYRVPHYDCARRSQPMSLLAAGRDPVAGELDGALIRGVVDHIFRDGYQLSKDDPRLTAQLDRIPQRVAMTKC